MSDMNSPSIRPQTPHSSNGSFFWKEPLWIWGIFLMVGTFVGMIFIEGLTYMELKWSSSEEYSYGYMIPAIVLFLIWQRKNTLSELVFKGSYVGSLLVAIGLVGYFIGELSALYIVVQYSFLLVLYGLFLAYMGWKGYLKIAIPLFILVFMIPLPTFLYNNLSAQLQLISSQLGVWFIRLFDISVYLEGNVIDLGSLKLQVVEACSGLRYLFPLMTVGFILAYFYKAPFWKRALLFFSSIPITVGMNSFRIGVIGYTVEHWGKSAAEGFLHDFEGWIVFMSSMVLMLVLAWLLNFISTDRKPLLDVLAIYLPEPMNAGKKVKERALPRPFIVSICLVVLATGFSYSLPDREDVIADRQHFETFPLRLDEWQGVPDLMESQYVKVLKFSDYLMVNYANVDTQRVNFYIAYYDSQRKGASVHSPKSCLPGGGWKINSHNVATVEQTDVYGKPLEVNRVMMSLGEEKKLVYYWFQQRGRVITNEYMVKWYLFWDALTRNRTDGALVRIITDIKPGESIESAEKVLTGFTQNAVPRLSSYIPD